MKLAATMTAMLAAISMTSARAAEAPDKLTATIERAVRPLLSQHDVPGIAVGVTAHGQQYFFSYGVATKEPQTPVTKDTLFEIGSISKTFAATLATYGTATGKLSLDDHPGKYMPALKGTEIDKASLVHLGTYTAGGLPLLFSGKIKTEAEAIAFLQTWKPAAAPGTQRRYSNPSIGLFGHVAALAMKGDYADIVERDLLPKLGLAHIRVPPAAMADYAQGYDRANKPVRAGAAPFGDEAFGIKSSTTDMVRYIELNMQPDSLEPALRRAIDGTHVGYFAAGGMVQGLGWEQYPYPVPLERLLAGNSDKMVFEPNAATPIKPPRAPTGATLFNKTGSTGGFGAYAAFVPSKRIGVVILSNRNMPTAARIAAAYAVLEAIAY